MYDLLLPPDVKRLKGVLEICKEQSRNQKRPASCVLLKSCSENSWEIPRKSFTSERILKAHNYAEYELCR